MHKTAVKEPKPIKYFNVYLMKKFGCWDRVNYELLEKFILIKTGQI
jgi:hypothetical protein